MRSWRRKFQSRVEWRAWVFGIVGPHGGMNVWVLYLGPLAVEFWPMAGETVPF